MIGLIVAAALSGALLLQGGPTGEGEWVELPSCLATKAHPQPCRLNESSGFAWAWVPNVTIKGIVGDPVLPEPNYVTQVCIGDEPCRVVPNGTRIQITKVTVPPQEPRQ